LSNDTIQRQIGPNSKTVQDRVYLQCRKNTKSHMVYQTAPFSMTHDTEQPLSHFSRSRYSFTLNIS